MNEYKLCIGCNQNSTKRNRIGAWHHVSEFHVNKQNADGLAGNCKYCRTRVVVESFRRSRLREKQSRNTLSLLNAMSRKLNTNSNVGYL